MADTSTEGHGGREFDSKQRNAGKTQRNRRQYQDPRFLSATNTVFILVFDVSAVVVIVIGIGWQFFINSYTTTVVFLIIRFCVGIVLVLSLIHI